MLASEGFRMESGQGIAMGMWVLLWMNFEP